jgi:trk system potassium uptake protein TrkA
MKIIIAGAGEVGFHLAKLLSYESQRITLIDTDKEKLAYADAHLDIKVVKGDATSISGLNNINTSSAELFIAVTDSETINITACVLAKQIGAKRTIARISNPEFLELRTSVGFNRFGIDELISPESLVASEIQLLLNQSVFNDTYEFEDGALTMLGLNLSSSAIIVGKQVKEAAKMFPEIHFSPIAIQRYGSHLTIIPNEDTQFQEKDHIVFMTSEGGDEELCKITGRVKTEIKNVMILGGGKIGAEAAKGLSEGKFNIKLIESDRNKALELADDLPNVLVIHGDGRNVELLDEENIADMDAFISVTGNSETNIMSCLVAKSKGVKKTVALVENVDYFDLSHTFGISTIINKKLIAANSIFRYIRKGDVVAFTKLSNMDAELLEFKVKPNSKINNKHVKSLKFPSSAIVAGVIRKGEGYVDLSELQIIPGDRVVVCCLPEAIKKVENFF